MCVQCVLNQKYAQIEKSKVRFFLFSVMNQRIHIWRYNVVNNVVRLIDLYYLLLRFCFNLFTSLLRAPP